MQRITHIHITINQLLLLFFGKLEKKTHFDSFQKYVFGKTDLVARKIRTGRALSISNFGRLEKGEGCGTKGEIIDSVQKYNSTNGKYNKMIAMIKK